MIMNGKQVRSISEGSKIDKKSNMYDMIVTIRPPCFKLLSLLLFIIIVLKEVFINCDFCDFEGMCR